MPAQTHTDSPTQRQYHVRYHVHGHTGGPFWSYVYETLDDAQECASDLRAENNLTVVGVFVRDISPWRPL